MTSVDSILKNKYALILTLALLAEGILYYSAFGSEKVPQNKPLEMFATDFGGWQMINEGHVDKETMDILRADDTVTRSYAKAAYPAPAGFFVAYFKTQRTGQAPHSPKNCLPGSGWEPLQEGFINVPVSVEPAIDPDQPLHRVARRQCQRGALLVPDPEARDRQRLFRQDLAGAGFHALPSQRYRAGARDRAGRERQ